MMTLEQAKAQLTINLAADPRRLPPIENRGWLISVSGLNGAGKSTLIKYLEKEIFRATGRRMVPCKETSLHDQEMRQTRHAFEQIVQHAQDWFDVRQGKQAGVPPLTLTPCEQERMMCWLFTCARRFRGQPRLRRAILNGYGFILDRYVWDTYAHLLKAGFDLGAIASQVAESYFLPDVSVFLICRPRIAYQRVMVRRQQKGERLSRAEKIALYDRIDALYPHYVKLSRMVPNSMLVDTSQLTVPEAGELVLGRVLSRLSPALT